MRFTRSSKQQQVPKHTRIAFGKISLRLRLRHTGSMQLDGRPPSKERSPSPKKILIDLVLHLGGLGVRVVMAFPQN